MSNELLPPMAFNKSEGIRAEVKQIDWASHSVFVTYPHPDGGMRIGDFWDFSECEIFPFVCLDKNGDKVFAGDEVWLQFVPDYPHQIRAKVTADMAHGAVLTAGEDAWDWRRVPQIELIKEDK